MLTATIFSATTPLPSLPLVNPVSPPNTKGPLNFFKLIDHRGVVTSLTISITTLFSSSPLTHARGLFQMPPVRLANRYYLVRAGQSEFESIGIVNTNPVAKTSVDNGLSEIGNKQTLKWKLVMAIVGFRLPLLRELIRLLGSLLP
ncbi:hypothetical protein RJ641_014402 [Dillenia turbinata]|uniref:Uncharacterized protein n=1 Tax=Dillenia turbinata TaxID=194707 RepID=A0AAN8UU72_9MAGN